MIWSPKDVEDFFKAHWTVRKYKTVAMPSDHLEAILTAAQRAPTDATAQMYSIIRLTDPVQRERIAKLSGNAHIASASEAFVLCGDVHRLRKVLQSGGFEMGNFPRIAVHFAIGDAVMAGQNMLVAAEMLGYRGCWIGGVMNALPEISEALQLPTEVFPFAALTLGVPDEPAVHRPRLPRSQVIFENTYQEVPMNDLKSGVNGMAAITARGDWAGTLARYFAAGGSMEDREKSLRVFLEKVKL